MQLYEKMGFKLTQEKTRTGIYLHIHPLIKVTNIRISSDVSDWTRRERAKLFIRSELTWSCNAQEGQIWESLSLSIEDLSPEGKTHRMLTGPPAFLLSVLLAIRYTRTMKQSKRGGGVVKLKVSNDRRKDKDLGKHHLKLHFPLDIVGRLSRWTLSDRFNLAYSQFPRLETQVTLPTCIIGTSQGRTIMMVKVSAIISKAARNNYCCT